MTNRELDAQCARILGLIEIQLHQDLEEEDFLSGLPPNSGPDDLRLLIPYFSTDANASRELLEWAVATGYRLANSETSLSDYKKFLAVFWDFERKLEVRGGMVIQLLATPLQIAEAFVECFGDRK